MISRACYVTCDHCGAVGPVDCYDGAVGARALAADNGFTRQRRRGEPQLDLCRKCTLAYPPEARAS